MVHNNLVTEQTTLSDEIDIIGDASEFISVICEKFGNRFVFRLVFITLISYW